MGLKLLKSGESTKRTQYLAVDLMKMDRLLATIVSSLASNNVMPGQYISVVYVVVLIQCKHQRPLVYALAVSSRAHRA
jgi:hypothetical protein